MTTFNFWKQYLLPPALLKKNNRMILTIVQLDDWAFHEWCQNLYVNA